MMNIRPVGMRVDLRLMLVRVVMIRLWRFSGVIMTVVRIRMGVVMSMAGRLMGVGMRVLIPKKNNEGNNQNRRSNCLNHGNFLTQEQHRYGHPEKRCAGKYHLTSGSTEMLGCLDV